MICLGIDPDTTNTALALLEVGAPAFPPQVLHVYVASADGDRGVEKRIVEMAAELDRLLEAVVADFADPEVVCIEGQDAYAGRQAHRRPNDLIHLAQVAGIAAGVARARFYADAVILMPRPSAWKGQVEKAVHQRRILETVGLDATLAGVLGAERMTKTQKGHVVDAIGLALWAAKETRLRRSA